MQSTLEYVFAFPLAEESKWLIREENLDYDLRREMRSCILVFFFLCDKGDSGLNWMWEVLRSV